MKKIISLLVIVCSVLMVSGCTKKEETKTMECTLNKNDVVSNYKLDSSYKIYYTGKIVKKVETIEKVTSDNNDIISTFENTFNNTYSKMKETYGGYTFEIKKTDNDVTSTVTIDYTKVDLKKLVSDQPAMKNIMNDNNELLLENLKETYESMGATCK